LRVANADAAVNLGHGSEEKKGRSISCDLARARTQAKALLRMGDEESIILEFLRARPGSSFARKEIARKAIKRTEYEKNPRWVDTPLQTLVARNLVEIDDGGLYQITRNSTI